MTAAPADSTIIVGAGIAGLSAAIALARDGHPVTVLEQASHLEALGAGIQLGPNAVRILQSWDMEELLRPHVTAPAGIAIHDGLSGECLNRIPLGRTIQHRHGAPYWVVHRADLQQVLLARLQQLDGVQLELGFQFDMYKRQNGHVCALDEADTAHTGHLLLGADGLWSQVRRQVTGFNPDPEFSGKTAWRTTIDTAALPQGLWTSHTGLWIAPNAHLVHYPIRSGRQLNMVAIIDDTGDDWQGAVWAAPADGQELLAHFAHWAAEPRRLLQLARTWSKWPLFRAPRGVRWPLSAGPVLLIGDAAHPVLPFLAQGAAMAIEDAAEIARSLKLSQGHAARAIAGFTAARGARLQKVRTVSEQMGRLYHLPGPFALARNFVLRHRNPARLLASLDWLYGYRLER